MGGKTSTSTQGISIPPSVLAQYQSVNARANQTASNPFMQYGGQFVAPINSEQQSGIAGTNTYAQEAQPYFGAAAGTLGAAQAGTEPTNAAALGLAGASAEQINPTQIGQQQIDQFMNPYLNTVLGSTSALLNQNNQQQQTGALGTAIESGAFGGDRTGIASANLEQQQNLANANIYSGIASGAFNTALGAAQQQQGVNLSAQQANRAALASAGEELAGIGSTAYGEGANTANELAALGTGAQSAGLAGAQAQLGAGTLQQQTTQAEDTARYNQFLQQQSYPFQVDQFLAGIAEGTGALSGSTTTTQQPGGFFSDRRLKYDIRKIGKMYDGQHIYSYKMHGDPRTHIGLIAQEVEKKRPESVGLASGYKTVDYGTATEPAANRGHFFSGGVVPIRQHMDDGGYAGPYSLSSILATQENMYQPNQSRYRNIPETQQQQHQLAVASGTPAPPPTGASNLQTSIGLGKDAYQLYHHFNTPTAAPSAPPAMQGDPAATGLGGADVSGASSPVAAPSSAALGTGDAGAADAAGIAGASVAPDTAAIAAPAAASAAGTAAAGAAGDAAATEAAALAADYVAADAAVAAVAAKRGGRMGLAGGGDPYEATPAGDPYSMSGGQLDIPDSAPPAKLQTAGPLQKRPTGLQTLMSLGQPDTASSVTGSLFSNEALASGGRAGYQDGGDPTADPDMLPEQIVTADRPTPEEQGPPVGLAGAVARPAANDDVVADMTPQKAARTGLGGWWDRNKTDVLPALEGIAAMGTYPTKHLGVALAAGLGAGAQAYMPTQQAQANLEATQLQNQRTGMLLNAVQAPQPKGTSGGAPPQPGFSGVGADPANIATQTQQRFAFKDIWTQQEQAQLQQQQRLQQLGLPNTLQNLIQQHTARMQNQQTALQQGALAIYNRAYDAAAATPGASLAKITAIDPLAAKQIQELAGNDPAAADGMAKAWASETGNQVYQFTGRKATTGSDGIARDPFTQRPLLGQTPVGQSAEENANWLAKLASRQDIGAPYKPALSETPQGRQLPLNPQPTVQVPGSQPSTAAPPQSTSTAAAPSRGAWPQKHAPLLGPAPDPSPNIIDGKPIEAKYQLPKQPTIYEPQTKQTESNWETIIKNRAELLDDAKALTGSSSQGLAYTEAAQALMKTDGVPTGLSAPAKVALSRVSQALGITPGTSATANQELAKYLANISVQSFKQNFGARPAAKEFDVQMSELNPNATMTPDAINDLLAFNSRNFNWMLQSGHRAAEYSAKNGNPQSFYDWNNTHFPQTDAVNGPRRPGQQTSGAGATITSKAQYDALPKGATYIYNGRSGTKQ